MKELIGNSNLTQCGRIKKYLLSHREIDQMTALVELGIMRLASRISEMRKRGEAIDRVMRNGHNRFGEKISYAVYSFGKEEL